ncbi:MAG: translation elongation factor Ts [Armatimonadota bacterium]
MAEITAQQVMELRQKTGAKMMDAKRALVDTDGNFEKAVSLLREKGLTQVAKPGRKTAEGTIITTQTDDHSAAAAIELNCETDFVAKTDQFKALANDIASWALDQTKEAVNADDLSEAQAAEIKETMAKTGENILFRRGTKFASETGVVESYIHLGGKIGVLVQVDGCKCDAARTLAKDLAMQVAAASPEYLAREDVPPAKIEEEMEIYRNLARNEGKPEQMLDKIAQGRLEKFFKENCLVEQQYIKDPDKQVKDLIAEVSKSSGTAMIVKRFVRYQLGQ